MKVVFKKGIALGRNREKQMNLGAGGRKSTEPVINPASSVKASQSTKLHVLFGWLDASDVGIGPPLSLTVAIMLESSIGSNFVLFLG